jgi:hypothetical protein
MEKKLNEFDELKKECELQEIIRDILNNVNKGNKNETKLRK